MEDNSPIDRHLAANISKRPMFMHDAMVFTIDTLDAAWIAAQSIFKDKATPEAALMIYDRINTKFAEKHAAYLQDVERFDEGNG